MSGNRFARAVSTWALSRLDPGARHVHLGAEDPRRRQVTQERREGDVRALQRLVGDVERRLHPGVEAERRHREPLSLVRLAAVRGDRVAVEFEANPVDLLGAPFPRSELLVDPVDGVVQALHHVLQDVPAVARRHRAEERLADVHPRLLAPVLEVPLVQADVRLGRLPRGGDLAERVERNDAADVNRPPGLDVARQRVEVPRLLPCPRVDGGPLDAPEHGEVRARRPLPERHPLRLVELRVGEGEARPGRPQAREVPIGEREALGERVRVGVDRRHGGRLLRGDRPARPGIRFGLIVVERKWITSERALRDDTEGGDRENERASAASSHRARH